MKTCGLDVHKDSIFCAIYNGKDYSPVKEYATTTVKIRQIGDYLRREGVSKVAMESMFASQRDAAWQYDTFACDSGTA